MFRMVTYRKHFIGSVNEFRKKKFLILTIGSSSYGRSKLRKQGNKKKLMFSSLVLPKIYKWNNIIALQQTTQTQF